MKRKADVQMVLRGENTAKLNPLGMPVEQVKKLFPRSANNRFAVVRVGKEGERTHLYDAKVVVKDLDGNVIATGAPICKSGYVTPNAQQAKRVPAGQKINPTLYRSNSQFIDCYRCVKLIALGDWQS